MTASARRIALSCIMGVILLWAWVTDGPNLNQFRMAVSVFLAVFVIALFIIMEQNRRPPA